MIRRKSLQIRGAAQDERRGKIKELGDSEDGGGYKPEERGEKGKILLHGPKQYVEDQRQRNITYGFHEVGGKAHSEQRVEGHDVFRRRRGVG